MSWNGHTVVDMDAHIRERADRFFLDYLDPDYRAPYQLLCEAVARQEKKGDRYALFGSRTAIVEQLETGRALGVRDTFGLTGRSEMEHGRDRLSAGAPRPAAADPPGGQLGRQGAARGHGPRLGRYRRALPDPCVELLRVARRRVRERALPRLSPLGRRFLRPGADPAQMDASSPICATSPPGSPSSNTGPSATPTSSASTSRRRPRAASCSTTPTSTRSTTRRRSLDLPILAHGGTARPPYGPGTLRPRRRLVPAARPSATRGPAWRRWAR